MSSMDNQIRNNTVDIQNRLEELTITVQAQNVIISDINEALIRTEELCVQLKYIIENRLY